MEIAEVTDRKSWERRADMAVAPLQQRWAYGLAMSRLGAEVLRLEIRDGSGTLGVVQVLRRRICGISLALVTRGPVWIGDPCSKERGEVLRCLRKALRCRLLVTPENEGELAGLFPVLTPGTTARLRLGDGMRRRMHGKWRNRLVHAERAGLEVRRLEPSHLGWLFDADLAAQGKKGYRALPRAFTDHWPGRVLALAAVGKGDPIAAMLFLCHGTTATYHIGWSGDEGRRVSAHNLLLWRAMQVLRAEGVEHLDLGTLDTVNAPGLARFKLGSGAEAHRLGGTWFGW